MLVNLHIDNYALIEQLVIDMKPGLTIITGETGAGKTILLGALSLILGKRADTSVLRDPSRKCIVEGEFNIEAYDLESFFENNDIDYEPLTLIRREIGANGKSRSFINDTPVTLNKIRELGIKLVDIHSQHENLNMSNHEFQLNVIDHFAGLFEKRNEYQGVFEEYQSLHDQYHDLLKEAENSKADKDYWEFQLDELNKANLRPGEQQELEADLEQLNHAGEIKSGLTETIMALSEGESDAIRLINNAMGALQKIHAYYPKAEEIISRLDSASIELKDIARETELLNEKVSVDPSRQQFTEERLNTIYSLQKKHMVGSDSELIDIRHQLENRLDEMNSYDERLAKLENDLKTCKKRTIELAGKLSERRSGIFSEIESVIMQILHDLGMPNARFRIKNEIQEELGITGADKIEFLFSANKNSTLMEISRAASGGELSRLMLSIKSLLSDSTGLPTIILDEIDAGVSGEVADKVGKIIKRMAGKMQVINITHLPQVAVKGDHHYLVYKLDEKDKTNTKVKMLNPEERQQEIAKMLSGEELTTAALDNARELLKSQP